MMLYVKISASILQSPLIKALGAAVLVAPKIFLRKIKKIFDTMQ